MTTSLANGVSDRRMVMLSVGVLVAVMVRAAFAEDCPTWESQSPAARFIDAVIELGLIDTTEKAGLLWHATSGV